MQPTRVSILALGAFWAAGAVVAIPQQHSYTQADIDAGARIYESNCGNCHGENGDRVVGVDFVKGTFKTAKSDDDIVKIIRNGSNGMPPSTFSEAQSNTIVAYVRSMLGGMRTPDRTGSAASVAGDAARGKVIFEGKGNCLSCHSINGAGGTTGPGFGGRGAAAGLGVARGGGGRGGNPLTPQQIETAILDPSAEIGAPYRVYQVVTKAGATARGTLLNRDTFSVQLRDSNNNLVGFQLADLRESGFAPSPMPSFKGKLTAQEVADVVTYLISVRSN